MTANKDAALAEIRSNIDSRGQHVYLVVGASYPRFCYSIGLSLRTGFELIIGGSTYYSDDQAASAINECALQLSRSPADSRADRISLPFGNFQIRDVHESWSSALALGAFDYLQRQDVPFKQLVPGPSAWTIDVPDMSVPWVADQQPVWRWLREPWRYEVPESSMVVTNHRAMRGERVTEGLRRDEDAWEIFVDADPDTPQRDVFVVPLSTLLGFDATLDAFTKLPVGSGLKRAHNGAWTRR